VPTLEELRKMYIFGQRIKIRLSVYEGIEKGRMYETGNNRSEQTPKMGIRDRAAIIKKAKMGRRQRLIGGKDG